MNIQTVTFIIDWDTNAGPTDVFIGTMDCDSLDTDPLFMMLDHSSFSWTQIFKGLRINFSTRQQRDEWLLLAGLKYGLRE